MAKKWVIEPIQIATAVDLSASSVTAPSNVQRLDRFVYQVNTAGAPIGTLVLQTSIDYNPEKTWLTPTWIDLPVPFQALTGTAHNYFVDIYSSGIVWLRLNFTAGVGSVGTLDAYISAKES